jgi:hypothetical protein
VTKKAVDAARCRSPWATAILGAVNCGYILVPPGETRMSKIIELTDEQYAAISSAAKERGQSPAMLIAEVAEELRDPERAPRYFETEDWFRHLGMTDAEIIEVREEVRQEAESSADA